MYYNVHVRMQNSVSLVKTFKTNFIFMNYKKCKLTTLWHKCCNFMILSQNEATLQILSYICFKWSLVQVYYLVRASSSSSFYIALCVTLPRLFLFTAWIQGIHCIYSHDFVCKTCPEGEWSCKCTYNQYVYRTSVHLYQTYMRLVRCALYSIVNYYQNSLH